MLVPAVTPALPPMPLHLLLLGPRQLLPSLLSCLWNLLAQPSCSTVLQSTDSTVLSAAPSPNTYSAPGSWHYDYTCSRTPNATHTHAPTTVSQVPLSSLALGMCPLPVSHACPLLSGCTCTQSLSPKARFPHVVDDSTLLLLSHLVPTVTFHAPISSSEHPSLLLTYQYFITNSPWIR